ncbi:MAG: metallophosphoesterase [Magnetococcales bacterium]|nr:metallophosphoesterase [Magnetococcales bacterium]
MSPTLSPADVGFFQKLKTVFVRPKTYELDDLPCEIHLMGDEIKIPHNDLPIRLHLGREKRGKTLWLYPENPLDLENVPAENNFLIFDPERYFSESSGFIRLEPGESVVLGRKNKQQQAFFHFPRTVSHRHLTVCHGGDSFVFKDLTNDSGTYIAPLGDQLEEELAASKRLSRLARIRDIFGGPIELLPNAKALDLIRQVNTILETEASRPLDDRGCPGGMVTPPEGISPLIIGDLHGQVDNLLKVLSENHFLERLESGELYVVLLGDAVHSEIDGCLEEMEDSMLMMDLIFKLKVRFPHQIFYLRGNHDSFSSEVWKCNIPQGVVWEQQIRKKRGAAYKEEMDKMYEQLPCVVCSDQFVACHAAPPKAHVTQELLINTYRYPGLVKEIIWNRLRRPNYPAGYTKTDVMRFRKGVGVAPETPFIVAHNPLSRDVSVWMDVGEIKDHHIVFSGLVHQVSVFSPIKGKLVPLIYTTEPLIDLVNRL